MNIDENITIIIPTKNRPEFIKRGLLYYEKSKFKGKILVADSSDKYHPLKFQKKLNRLLFSKKKNFQSRVQFIKCNHLKFELAVMKALHKVKTKYIVVIPDDDIIITKKIHVGLNFLEKNKDYSGFTGQALTLRTINNLPFAKDIILSKEELLESEYKFSADRFINFLKKPLCATFTVTSKSLAIRAFGKIISLNSQYLRSYYFGETFHALVILAEGKVKSFDFGFCVRQHHNDHLFNRFNFYEFISDKNFSKTVILLSKFLLKYKNNKFKTVNIELALKEFYKKIFRSFFLSSDKSTSIKHFIKTNLNPKILFKIRKIYHYQKYLKHEFQEYIDIVQLYKDKN